MSTVPVPIISPTPIQLYANYPFAKDDTYQQGLAGLIAGGALDGNPPPDVKDEILRRTRVFYFNRVMGHSISMDEVREYELSSQADAIIPTTTTDDSVPPAASSLPKQDDDENESGVLTFAELQALIESGKEDLIPNNKIIPDALNEAPPSQSTAPPRKKPRELAVGVEE